MKESKYNFVYSDSGNVVLYNTKTGYVFLLSIEEYNSFLQGNFTNDNIIEYKTAGFIVDDCIDETTELILRCDNETKNSLNNKYRILTTTACNAHCFYCYEKGIKNSNMSLSTAESVANFILEQSKDANLIRLEWFGGEPLLNPQVIDTITSIVLSKKSPTTKYKASLVTNATKINDQIVKKIVNEWLVNEIQITIDAIGTKYETIKGLEQGSFDKVMAAVELLVNSNIKVKIRINYNRDNFKIAEETVKFFSESSLKGKIALYAARIFDTVPGGNTFNLEEETIMMDNVLYKYGFRSKLNLLPPSFKTRCSATFPKYFTIDPQGNLFKCDCKFLNKNIVATVNDYKEKDILHHRWTEIHLSNKCKNCKLLPICWGGCMFNNDNNIYPCFYSNRIILNRLRLILEEYNKCS